MYTLIYTYVQVDTEGVLDSLNVSVAGGILLHQLLCNRI